MACHNVQEWKFRSASTSMPGSTRPVATSTSSIRSRGNSPASTPNVTWSTSRPPAGTPTTPASIPPPAAVSCLACVIHRNLPAETP